MPSHRYSPDILAAGLDVVFCGLNPASTAARDGHNFSNRSNRFWLALHRAGFTSERLAPQDERRLLAFSCGITAVVRRATRRADEIAADEYRQARRGFEARMRRYEPRALAFLGKSAFAAMLDQREVAWGGQPTEVAGAIAWVLPNPSGLNRSFTIDALVSAYAELKVALRKELRSGTTRPSR